MNQLQFVYLNDLSKKASWETTWETNKQAWVDDRIDMIVCTQADNKDNTKALIP